MNQFALNGATLNGLDGIPLTAGNASVAATSLVLATSTLVQAASANASAAASVNINASVRVIAGASAQLQASSEVALKPTHYQAAGSNLLAIAQVTAYVLRNVSAQANAQGQALVVAIPASTLAQAGLTGLANVTAQAVRIQRASSSLAANAETLANSIVKRNTFAAVAASANCRVEASLKHAGVNRHDGFADINTQVLLDVQDAGIVRRLASCEVQAQASCSAQAQKVQPAHVSSQGFAVLDAQALVTKTVQVLGITGLADVSAQSIRTQTGSANLTALSSCTAFARHTLLAAVTLENRVNLEANATRWLYPVIDCQTKASVTAEAARIRLVDVNLAAMALLNADAAVNVASTGHFTLGISEVSATALILRMAASSGNAGVELAAHAIVMRRATATPTGMAAIAAIADIKRTGAVNVNASAQINGNAEVKRFVTAAIKTGGEVLAQAQSFSVLRMASAVFGGSADCRMDALCVRRAFAPLAVSCELRALASASDHYYGEVALQANCTIAANASTNPAAFDPPERTMMRPYIEREMLRPFTQREMQRYA